MKYILILVFLSFFTTCVTAQDLFSYSASVQYATHLFDNKEYPAAYEELLRIEKDFPVSNDTVDIMLLKVCAAMSKNKELFSRIRNARPPLSNNLFNLMMVLTLSHDSLLLAGEILHSNSSQQYPKYPEFLLQHLILSRNYAEARAYLPAFASSIPDTSFYNEILQKQAAYRYKRKGIAVMMSVLVPASGKFYVKQSYDAGVGLVLTGIHGLLAYRAFDRYGTSSVFAWVNVAAAGFFYFGNIWGTAVATDRYNNKVHLEIKHAIKNHLPALSYR